LIATQLEAAADQPLAQRSYEELVETHHWLQDLAAEVTNLLDGRQTAHHSGSAGRRLDGITLAAYVYAPLPVRHPVLNAGVMLLRGIRTARRRIRQALVTRA
jgi:hypothetical protein